MPGSGAWPTDSQAPGPGPSGTTSTDPGSSAPGSGAPQAADGKRAEPGLREQLGRLFAAVRRVVAAHVALARAEAAAIVEELRRAAVLVGLAVVALLFAGALLTLGLVLFLGEWLFGSIGWGVAVGSLAALGVAGAAALGIVRVPGVRPGGAALVGLVAGVVVGLALGFGWLHNTWTELGTSFLQGVDPAWRTIAAAALGSGVVLGLVGLVGGAAVGRSGTSAGAGLVIGAILGLVVGPLTAIDYDPSPAAGVAVTIGLGVWLLAMILDVWRHGVDLEALRARYWPGETIETTKETIEWLREQRPLGRKS